VTVIATAGHVDHGKSSLVQRLTGTDPDRRAEEQRRGMTIDLGFAHTTLPDGRQVSFVDVPGHARFLTNMLAGVGAVGGCLFVVDATEGWKPQSEEHLRSVEMLGVRCGVIVLTKVDLTDADGVEVARLDVADHVAGSVLSHAEVVPVSALTGSGIDDLLAALGRLTDEIGSSPDRGRARLWVDRAFTIAGSGTVVTGTLAGGALTVDERVAVEPGGHEARIRGLQTAGVPVERAAPGTRVAINLAGLDRDVVHRGVAVVRRATWHLSDRFDASCRVLPSLGHDLTRRGAHVLHLGSGEFPCRVRVLGADRLEPGGSGAIRVHLAVAIPLEPGDRFVLRESGRGETIGGGEVLDVAPILPAATARPDRSLARAVRERGWVRVNELDALIGGDVADAVRVEGLADWCVDGWLVDPAVLADAVTRVGARVDDAGDLGVDLSSLSETERVAASRLDGVTIELGRVRRARGPDVLAAHPALEEVRRGGFAPADPESIDRAARREMVRRGLLFEHDGIVFHPDAVAAASACARCLSAAREDGFTVAEFRDATGTTRRYALPLLAILDAQAITRRRGDRRIAAESARPQRADSIGPTGEPPVSSPSR
jgi:selenocysteine-specific elongation factor